MKPRNKISIGIAVIVVIASVAPGGSVLNHLLGEIIGGDLRWFGVLILAWFGVHGILVFRETAFYAKRRRVILWSAISIPIAIGAALFGADQVSRYLEAERRAELKRAEEAEEARTQAILAERQRKESACETLSAGNPMTPFCKSHLEDKAATLRAEENRNKLSWTKSAETIVKIHKTILLNQWEEFLLANKDSWWTHVRRSRTQGDNICLGSTFISIGPGRRNSYDDSEWDQFADGFVDRLNDNHVGDLKWFYDDLGHMKFDRDCPLGAGSPSDLYRLNRYKKRIP